MVSQTDSEVGSSSAMSRSSDCNNAPSTSAAASGRRQAFLDIVRQSNIACQNGDFPAAVALYSEALKIDPNNHILYSNRSAALIKMGQFSRALQDALKAKELNSKWSKAYYREGVALQCLGKHADALVAFSCGLSEDPNSSQLLSGLIEAATKSPLKAKLESTFEQLVSMKLSKSPFVVMSVVGQELLSMGHYTSAVTILEKALRIGTTNLKLKGSVYSALSSAYWALNSLDKAIGFMQQDLGVAKSLGDVAGECRAQGNLGSAYFSQANYKDALTSHRLQLVLAMKSKDTRAAACALTSLGHVYTAIGDYSNALASHKQCFQLLKQMGDLLQESREIGNVGAVYLVMGDFDNAVECHMEHLRLAKQLGNKVEEARACSSLGSCYHYKRNFEQGVTFHNHVLKIAKELGDKSIEARAYAGLGHAARCMGDYAIAKTWHSKQLDIALSTKDKVNEGRACSNLGIVFHLMGDHEAALKLHQSHLSIAVSLHDRSGMGRAYGNIGNAYNSMGCFDQAIKYHKQELAISKEVNDRSSEASTHGNLAVAYQALGIFDKALVHYHSHLSISRELKDTNGEACALLNLGNCHSSMQDFAQAIPFYENYLMLSQELSDVEGEGKACHFLGFAHYSLGHFKEAVRYYNQDLCLAKELQNTQNIARAYCNLGLTHLSIGNLEDALECQKYFLAVSHSVKDIQGKYRALGNIGNIMLKMNKPEEAIKGYQKQVLLAKSHNDKGLEASAYAALGNAYRMLKRFDLALGYHTQELTILQEINDPKGECKAHGSLGAVHMALGNFSSAMKYYDEILERAKELKDPLLEAQTYGNLGIARINMGNYEEAANYFEMQINILESLSNSSVPMKSSHLLLTEKGRAFGNLGDCYSALGDYKESFHCHQRHLQVAVKSGNLREQERTYRPLGLACKSLGNPSVALNYFEKRLGILNQLVSDSENVNANENQSDDELTRLKYSALLDLGEEYLEIRNLDHALNCFQQQLNIAKELGDREMEADTSSLMGKALQLTGKNEEAFQHHETDLRISKELNLISKKARAYGNLGLVQEGLQNFEQALVYHEHHLNAATQADESLAKAVAFGAVGRVHHALGNNIQAVAYLQQALQLVQKLNANEEEAKIRHFLGLAFWRHGDLESAHAHLERSSELLESTAHGKGSLLCVYERQVASYQALEQILVQMERTDLALMYAEKSKTLANSRLHGTINHYDIRDGMAMSSIPSRLMNNVDALIQRINHHRVAVLYFSVTGGYLYSWLLVPDRGIVKFNESCISNEKDDEGVNDMGTLLEKYLEGTRDALGIDFNFTEDNNDSSHGVDSSSGSNERNLEEIGDKLNQENDKTGFLRMVSRNHRFNCSSYSLSSLFSVGSTTGSVKNVTTSRPGSTRSRRSPWQGPSSLRSLHQMLIAPFEEELNVLDQTCFKELVLVVDTDLILVPFPILRSGTNEEYLCEKFRLIVTPSLSSIRNGRRLRPLNEGSVPLVIGNPSFPPGATEQLGFNEIPRAQNEANMVSEILNCQPLLGAKATKDAVLNALCSAECVHFATHISWKLAGIVLAPRSDWRETNVTDSNNSNVDHLPSFSDYLLTAADILKLRMSARLVVLSSCHTKEKSGVAKPESLITLTKALLAAGVTSVLITLWPVPETASKIFFRSFYSSLLQGSKASHALTEAMLTVQHTKHFAHPANWAGYLLMGSDVQVSNKVMMTSKALWELMKVPETSRDALRVSLHLIEKSLQRIHSGQKNAMYTTQKSIENKVGDSHGWKELLMSVGFRFESASNGLPAAVFFPQCDPGERLVKCSGNLQALLGLSPQLSHAFTKLLSTPECGEAVISILRQAIAELAVRNSEGDKVEVKVDVKSWGAAGCHELLASLDFDLMEVGENEVIVAVGKRTTVRTLQLALHAALALFGNREVLNTQEFLERSLSLESFEIGAEEYDDIPPEFQPNGRVPHIAMGRGAFTSYVRSRGEPDGHTNNTPENKQSFCPSSNRPIVPAKPMLRNPRNNIATYQNLALHRAESSSSESSSADWENGITVNDNRYPAPDLDLPSFPSTKRSGRFVQHASRQVSSNLAQSASKKVTWKMNEAAANNNMVKTSSPTNLKPWMNSRSGLSYQKGGTNDIAKSSPIGWDLPFNDIYQDRNIDLGLAPSLSKLLASTSSYRLPLDVVGGKMISDSEGGNMSMDDTLSTFDQLSLVGDPSPAGPQEQDRRPHKLTASGRSKGISSKLIGNGNNKGRTPHPKNGSGPFVTTAEISPMSLSQLPQPQDDMGGGGGGSTTSSSKSSPSDFSKERDEGDGRSLTDSQYGSYSPSMAQNDIIVQTASVVFNNTGSNNNSCEIQGPKKNHDEIISYKSNHESTVRIGISQRERLVDIIGQSHNAKKPSQLIPSKLSSFANHKPSQC